MIKSRHSQFLLYTLIVVLFTANFLNAGGKNAAVAMALCVIPGGGQFYTERYLAGVAIGSAELALGYYAYKYHREENFEKRNSMLWWGLFVFGYSLADAYVGAKMYGFELETDIDRVSLKYSWKL
ncbi:MAG TPA: hypothetical protein ENI34_10835 [candidate division WOR-3 bacterium]|uniref:DUF5683 domain-containing protein n=1 Tax=candidate division WOR-3 bacterium TaxID=2052148 RepID=A0A9C9EQE3_UNCW3|nr:hypothetical protein [candidate division WOR-3 bacterium]